MYNFLIQWPVSGACHSILFILERLLRTRECVAFGQRQCLYTALAARLRIACTATSQFQHPALLVKNRNSAISRRACSRQLRSTATQATGTTHQNGGARKRKAGVMMLDQPCSGSSHPMAMERCVFAAEVMSLDRRSHTQVQHILCTQVAVTAHPASLPRGAPESQKQQWRVLRFNDTRQSVSRVVLQPDSFAAEAQADCLAFSYLKTMASAGNGSCQ